MTLLMRAPNPHEHPTNNSGPWATVEKLFNVLLDRVAALEAGGKSQTNTIADLERKAEENQVEIDMMRSELRGLRSEGVLGAAISGLDATIRSVNAPKKIIRDGKGRAIGLEVAGG